MKSNQSLQPFPHLSKNNPIIKALAESPATANRWCVKFRGEMVSPRGFKTVAFRHDPNSLGTFRDCRLALQFVSELEGLQAIGVWAGDVLRVFPLNPPAEETEIPHPQPEPADATAAISDAPEGHSEKGGQL